MLLGLFLLTTTASAGAPSECEAPVGISQLQGEVLQTTLSYATLNIDDFQAAYKRSHEALDCVTEQLPELSIVEFHRTEALGALVEGDHERCRTAFQALLSVQPDWVLPANLAPEDGVLAQKLEEARTKPPSLMVDVDVPAGLKLLVDGKPATQRPANTPFVVQVLGPDGGVLWSDYVLTGEPMLDLAPLAPAEADVASKAPEEEPAEKAEKPEKPEKAEKSARVEGEPGEKGRWVPGIEIGTAIGGRIDRHPSGDKRLGYGLRVGTAAPVGVPFAIIPTADVRLVGNLHADVGLGIAAMPKRSLGLFGLAAGYRHQHFVGRLGFFGSDAGGAADLTLGWMFL